MRLPREIFIHDGMALFGLVWLLRMRGGECGCAECKREKRALDIEDPGPEDETRLDERESNFSVHESKSYTVESKSYGVVDDCSGERTTAHLAEVCVSNVECDAGNVGVSAGVAIGDSSQEYEIAVTRDANVQTDFEDEEGYAYDACGTAVAVLYDTSEVTKPSTASSMVQVGEGEVIEKELSDYYNNPQSEYEWQFFEVSLDRGAAGLGFSIAGGTDGARRNDDSIYITRLTDDGAATIDGRLRLNDAILQVNGVSVMGVPHAAAVEALKRAGNHVTLYVRRANPSRRSVSVVLEKGLRGLGFSIAGGRGSSHAPGDDGVFVTQVSAAAGKLRVGDRLVAVNNPEVGETSLVGVTHAEAVAALKAAGDTVELLVIPAIRSASQSDSLCGRQRSQATSCSALHELAVIEQDIPRGVRTVTLRRSGSRLGMDIVGGEGGGWGVFVSGVAGSGAAAGRLHKGDQILAVDAADLTTASHEQAARALKGTGPLVTIKAQYKPEEYRCLEAKIRELNMQILRDRIASGGELTKSEENLFYRR